MQTWRKHQNMPRTSCSNSMNHPSCKDTQANESSETDRQYNVEKKKKDKRTDNNIPITTQKTND
jgi:hypothetical protein